jgi:S-sulfo-L-cysteine synthase (3-phospho-L-serine-dependent)
MSSPRLILVESNTTGSGRLFCSSALRLGLRPLILVRDPARYSYIAADHVDYRVTDTSSLVAVLDACRELDGSVAGVISSSEYFIATAAEAARALGLPHLSPEAVRACRDKHAQRVTLSAAGIGCPAFAAARTAEDASMAAARIGYPVVVKPTLGTGSIAVRLCGTEAEVRGAVDYALGDPDPALPPQEAVLVEEYLTGAEYSAELMNHEVVGITAKLLGEKPYFVEIGHDFPAPLGDHEAKTIGDVAVAAVRSLGLGWGGAHVELRYNPRGNLCVVEVNPRLAGGMITRAVQEATGIDMIFQAVAAAVGRPQPLEPQSCGAASIRFLLARAEGWLTEIHGVAEAELLPGVVEVGITSSPGQYLVRHNSFRDRLGYVIAGGASNAGAAKAAEAALALLSAAVVKDPVPIRTRIQAHE